MDTTNPFVWILGFVLIFWIIGGGNGFGWGNGRAIDNAVAVNSGVGTRDLLDTMFAGFGGLKDQSTQQTFLLNGLITQGNAAILGKIDQSEKEAILRENANLRQNLARYETKEDMQGLLNPVYANLAALGCEVSKLPRTLPLYASGVTGCGQAVPAFSGCGC